MVRFNRVYPFTTENIKGYMEDIDLTGKKVITVTGSGDQALNAILNGCRDITCFDINPNANPYMQDKILRVLELDYEEFIHSMVYHNCLSKKYPLEYKYYNPKSKIRFNNYLSEHEFYRLKSLLKEVTIKYRCANVTDLVISEHYDYMFLSNISDYIHQMYGDMDLEEFYKLLLGFLEYIDYIYMAYIYDYNSKEKRSRIDDIDEVKRIFKNIDSKIFPTALEGKIGLKDAVLIMKRSDYFGK